MLMLFILLFMVIFGGIGLSHAMEHYYYKITEEDLNRYNTLKHKNKISVRAYLGKTESNVVLDIRRERLERKRLGFRSRF